MSRAPELAQRPDQLVWDTKYFLNKDREILRTKGFIFDNLHGKSIEEQVEEFPSRWLDPLPDRYGFKELRSRNSEVAFMPDSFYLKGSEQYTFEEQRKIVDEMSGELVNQGLNSAMVIGEIADYTELVLRYFHSHGKMLNYMIRSATPGLIEGKYVWTLAVFGDGKGPLLDIRDWQKSPPVISQNAINFDIRKPGIGIAPLVFPA